MLGETSTEAATGAGEHGEALLRVRDLSVAYAGVQALHGGVAGRARSARSSRVLGNNGAGKTHPAARRSPARSPAHRGAVTGGAVELGGRPLLGREPRAWPGRASCRCRRAAGSSADLTVEENLRAGGLRRARQGARASGRASWVHELFPILAERAQPARRAAVGRRAADAGDRPGADGRGRACCCSTSPRSAWRPRIVGQIGEVIREINRQGVTVVLVEQNAAMALAVADRAVVLEVGRVALEGTRRGAARRTEQVRDRYLGGAAAGNSGEAAAARRDPRRASSELDGRRA